MHIFKNKLLVAYDDLKEAKIKAEENDNLKTAFLANISHELRTPMNGVIGFTELLKEPNLTEASKEKYIGIIERSGERILFMLEDILELIMIQM
jgi:signal transduction histidine kinase